MIANARQKSVNNVADDGFLFYAFAVMRMS